MNVVLLGAPGVGKGTAAKKLSEHFGLPHISTGDVLRDHISKQTSLGTKAKKFVDSGKLVPDELVTEMVKDNLNEENATKGFFLDGYPRNAAQADILKTFVKIDTALNFVAPNKVVIERLAGRRTCTECKATYNIKTVPPKEDNVCDRCGSKLYQRSDETPEVISERLKVYENETKPVVDFYRNEGIMTEIDGTQDVEGVVRQCVSVLSK